MTPAVLFDVDGTLVDTNYLHTLAWARAFSDVSEWAPMNAIHRLVGMGSDQLVPRLLGHDCPAASDRRKEHYQALADEIRPFPGAADALRNLRDRGVNVVLATSSPASELDLARKVLDVDDVVAAVTTDDDVDQAKPAPDVFVSAMQSIGADPAMCLAVGDSVWDIRGARAAGLACIGVESGGFSRHELSEAGALHVYEDIQHLADQILTSAIGQLLSLGRRP